ncbi:MAG TPA: CoA transferase [Dehalococcoidia bacterium]
MSKPLDGIRVIDFTNAVAGPTATSLLGDYGAHVIKVEAPDSRFINPPGAAPLKPGAPDEPYNRVMHFNELNRSKHSLVLDLARPQGHRRFLQLASVCDVVVENFSPRVLSNLRIDYPDLRVVRPDIIVISMPAFGKSGPYRDRISYGPGIDAMSGLSYLTGYQDGPPMKPGNFFCDQNAAQLAVISCLAALRHRAHTGEGQWIECAMIEGELQVIAEALIDYQINGRIQTRTGNRHPRIAPHGVYPCMGDDKWVAIAAGDDDEFRALCSVMGRPELGVDARFATLEGRLANQDSLDEAISGWTRGRDHLDVQRELQAAGVPAGAALNTAELLADEHVRARGGFEEVEYPDLARPFPHTRAAFKLRVHQSRIDRRAPQYGEHNRAVLCDLLGLQPAALDELKAEGITRDRPTEAATQPGSRQ